MAGLFERMVWNSSDGINWTGHQLAINTNAYGKLDKGGIDGSVIKDGSLYKMWYAGSDTSFKWRIMYCESQDGINWTNHQMIIDVNNIASYDNINVSAPWVINDNGVGKMWYYGNDSYIIYAESLQFLKDKLKPNSQNCNVC